MSTAAGCVFTPSVHYPLELISALFASARSNGANAGVNSPEKKDKGKGKSAVVSPDVSMEEDEDEVEEEEEEEEYEDEEMEDVRVTHRLSITQCINLACLGRGR